MRFVVDRQAFGAVRLTLPGNSSSRSERGQRDFRFLGVNELEVLRKWKRITTPIELQEVTLSDWQGRGVSARIC
jgi:hypothetical protein